MPWLAAYPKHKMFTASVIIEPRHIQLVN